MFEGWSLQQRDFRIERNRAVEGLFTLGSGYLHVRGALEEPFDDDPQNVDFTRLPTNVTSERFRETKAKWGTYVAGVFGKHPLLATELINLPWFCGFGLEVDGERFNGTRSRLAINHRELQLDHARIRREVAWNTGSGNAIRLRFERFVSAAQSNVCVQQLILTPVDRGARVAVRVILDTDVRTNGFDHLAVRELSVIGPNGIRAHVCTDRNETLVISAYLSATEGQFESGIEGRRGWTQVSAELPECGSLHLNRVTVIEASRDLRSSLSLATPASLDNAVSPHFPIEDDPSNRLFTEHAAVWKKRWDGCDIQIEGDPQSQLAVRTALYHLLRCHVDDSRVAIDAKGYSGDAYWGRFFWDTDIFLLQFYLYTAPRKARTLVDFRVNTLPGARRNAARYGYPGARYAWESDPEGDECCPNWQYADHEVHVTADVVHGLAHFAAATGDEGYLCGRAADVLIETARYWMRRVDWRTDVAADPRVGRRSAKGGSAPGNSGASHPMADTGVGRTISEPVLLGVMGPDEYTPISDNNAYTNRMVAFGLERAAHVAEHRRHVGGTPPSAEEIASWREVAAKLPIPRHPDYPRLVLQCDAFEKLAEPRFDEFWKDRGRSFASQVSQERLYRSKCLKQADVLMLMAVFPHEFSDEEVRAAWAYYVPYTTHDSSLSPGVHALIACRLGLDDEAWRFWQQSCAVDFDIERGGAAEGIHIANCGAIWQMAVFGYAGVRTAMQSEQLTFSPRLPARWSALRFPLIWKGSPVRIEIERSHVVVTNRGDRSLAVRVADNVKTIEPGASITWDVPP